MLTNRSTRIKVHENGTLIKTIPNATINFGLDTATLTKMIALAIRLSPQDPLYLIEKVTLHGKADGKDVIIFDDEDKSHVTPNDVKKIVNSCSPLESLVLSIDVQRPLVQTENRPKSIPRPPRHSKPTEEEPRLYYKSPGRRTGSPANNRVSSRPTTPRNSFRGQPSPHRNKTPKKIPLPMTAPTPSKCQRVVDDNIDDDVEVSDPLRLQNDAKSDSNQADDLDLDIVSIYPNTATTPQEEESSPEEPAPTTLKPMFDNPVENLVDHIEAEDDNEIKPYKEVDAVSVFSEDEEEENETWRLVRASGPDEIQSFKPFSNAVATHRMSTLDFIVDEDHFSMNTRKSMHNRQSIINEDDFHTPEGSPLRQSDSFTPISDRDPVEPETSISCQYNVPDDAPEAVSAIAVHEEPDVTTLNEHTKEINDSEKGSGNEDKVQVAEENVTINVSETMADNDDSDYDDKDNRQKTPDASVKTPERARTAIRRATVSSANKAKNLTRHIESGPLYSTGKTAAETARQIDQNMRNYDNNRRVISPHRRRKIEIVHQPTRSKSNKEGGELSPLLFKSSKLGPDGRPSTGTMEKQWEFMRAHFVNNADDELEWLMVSKHKGAYKYAKRKHSEAEDKYHKALFDCEASEQLHKQVNQMPNGVGVAIPKIVNQLGDLQKILKGNNLDESGSETFIELQKKLKPFTDIIDSDKDSLLHKVFSSKTLFALKAIATEAVDKASKAIRKARELSASIPAELSSITSGIAMSRKSCDDALNEMEKWSKREKETDEYPLMMKQEEEEWFSKELVSNTEALCAMRSFIPVNITEVTVTDIITDAKNQNGLLTFELANEIKNNRLLHWLVTHKDDIASSNFLVGEKKGCFENLEALDLIEMRALSICLPEKFELDGDGKKNEWRTRFMSRVKQMVSQSKGDTVKGGWDGTKNKRSQVKMPPLKPEQERRSIYFYRSKEQCQLRLKQYDDKETMLKKKLNWFESAKKAADEAKKEYDTILNEMRDPDLKAQYGVEQFAMAKDIAKQEWLDAENKRKNLDREVKQLEKTIASNPISRETFLASMEEIEEFLQSKGIDWSDIDQPVLIEGVFDPCPEINRIERKATKFVSAEEEAEQRKRELMELKSKKDASIASTEDLESLSNGIDTLDGNTGTLSLEGIVFNESGFKKSIAEDFVDVVPSTSLDQSLTSTVTSALGSSVPIEPGSIRRISTIADRYNEAASMSMTPISNKLITPRKRGSILDSANPALLNCLNNMFSPESAGRSSMAGFGFAKQTPKSSIRRGTMFSPSSVKITEQIDTETNIDEDKKEIKTTRSKLLQRLLGVPSSTQEATPSVSSPRTGSGPSFLEQLKARSRNPFKSPQQSTDDSNPQETSAKPRSFLDELKFKTGIGRSSAAPPSFLDQIKAKSNKDGTSNDENAVPDENINVNIGTNPHSAMKKPSLGNTSFLDAIKSRRVEA